MSTVTLNTASYPFFSHSYLFEKYFPQKYSLPTLPFYQVMYSIDAKLHEIFVSANRRYVLRTSRTMDSMYMTNFVFLYPILFQRKVSITFLEDIAKISIKGKVHFLIDFNFKKPDEPLLVGYMATNGVYKISEIFTSELHNFIKEKECNIQIN